MSLPAGARLGPYQIVATLGTGGMGEVYKARDTRLDRTVAIKTLLPDLLTDPALRARFEREARAISSLDHPNICVVHDVGREGEIEYLVMQYVEGETLAARLARGPLPLDQALRYAIGIAAALDKAHRAGILHRDLKPGNVMLATSAGRDASAKLLDFGLAKLMPTRGIAAGETVAATAASPLTGQGTILGTLLYMSPEQLEGGAVDARSDIFSFGAVLYEMLTGRRAFDANSQASIIAAILERDPPPVTVAAPITPPALDRVVRKCLSKDPDRRWQSAADLCDELSWIAQAPAVQQPSSVRRQPGPRALLPLVAAALTVVAAAAALGWWMAPRGDRRAKSTRHLAIALPADVRLTQGGIAVSPDGRSMVFVASNVGPPGSPNGAAGTRRLYLRRFDSVEATPIDGTEGARAPFFSPDGQSIGYFTSSALMTVSLRGGAPARLNSTPPVTRGGAWLPDDSVVMAATQGQGLDRLAPGATTRQRLTTLDESVGERGHAWPQALPGGKDVLFTIRRGTAADVEAADIALVNVATGERRSILQGGAFARYSPTGHLLFVRGGALSSVPFDLKTRRVTGPAAVVAQQVAVDPWVGGAHYAVAADGTLLFYRGRFPESTGKPVWVDRGGKAAAGGVGITNPHQPRISPDGTRGVFTGLSADGDNEIFLADLIRGTAVRFSTDPRDDFSPVWTPDGRSIIWSALPPARPPFLVMRAADGAGPAEEVAPEPKGAQFVGSVSTSGVLAYTKAMGEGGATDIWTVPLNGPRNPSALVATSAREFGPEFSPDGRWIAYVSDESGAYEIYVVPYPGPGGKRQITNGGGVSPAWRRDGRELFYQTPAGLMVMEVSSDPQIQFAPPRLLFGGNFSVDSREDGPRGYDVAPDGKRFLMVQPVTAAAAGPGLHVLVDW